MYDELVKRIWECASGECFNCSQYTETTNASVCSKELMKQAADAIEELSKAQAQWIDQERNALLKSIPKWIPVTERLPKEEEIVLAFGTLGVAWLDWRHDNKWCCYGGVTHWMPLPMPPKEEV